MQIVPLRGRRNLVHGPHPHEAIIRYGDSAPIIIKGCYASYSLVVRFPKPCGRHEILLRTGRFERMRVINRPPLHPHHTAKIRFILLLGSFLHMVNIPTEEEAVVGARHENFSSFQWCSVVCFGGSLAKDGNVVNKRGKFGSEEHGGYTNRRENIIRIYMDACSASKCEGNKTLTFR